MENRELAQKLDTAIGSQKTFPSGTFGECIVGRLPKIKHADDLMFVGVLVTRRMKIGTEDVYDVLTEKQRERAWDVLVAEEAVQPTTEEFEYRLTGDIWGYEPGVGKAQSEFTKIIRACNDAEARLKAERSIGSLANYRWSEWAADKAGWERHRTAVEFNASWMRIERL